MANCRARGRHPQRAVRRGGWRGHEGTHVLESDELGAATHRPGARRPGPVAARARVGVPRSLTMIRIRRRRCLRRQTGGRRRNFPRNFPFGSHPPQSAPRSPSRVPPRRRRRGSLCRLRDPALGTTRAPGRGERLGDQPAEVLEHCVRRHKGEGRRLRRHGRCPRRLLAASSAAASSAAPTALATQGRLRATVARAVRSAVGVPCDPDRRAAQGRRRRPLQSARRSSVINETE